jgi:hypothetical protein
MSIDEALRVASYTVLAPGFFYLGLVARNRRQRWMSALAWAASVFFLLLLVGLVLMRHGTPQPILLYINTVVVMGLAYVVLRLCWQFWRVPRAARAARREVESQRRNFTLENGGRNGISADAS